MDKVDILVAPFPWFGGKRKVAGIVWSRFAGITNYVEPFFGSGAMLLCRPEIVGTETVNDLDGYVANFWRAVQHDPEAVVEYADNPVNENDLTARHIWLVNEGRERIASLEGDPDFFDAKVAGWWVWGICCWIGGGFCSGKGPWTSEKGQRVHLDAGRGVNRQCVHLGDAGRGVNRQCVHLGGAGRGVNRKRVHLGDAGRGVNRQCVHLGAGRGVNRKRVHLGAGRGVNRKRVHLGDAGRGQCETSRAALVAWMSALADRLRLVRVCCGDWHRVLGPTPTFKLGLTGVFLDPPYGAEANRDMGIYATDSGTVAGEVLTWCKENGDNPKLLIALCGYEGEHNVLADAGWKTVEWKAAGGYGSQGQADTRGKANAARERIWFSPACVSGNKENDLWPSQ
jgi:hypothetical protein